MRRVQVSRDIPYSPGQDMCADIYAPVDINKSTPLVVFFYGGRWRQGRKQDYLFVAHALATHGVCCVLPDYRRFPEVQFPVFIEDGAKALAWAASNIEGFGGTADNVFVMGHSAGAHIASMIALNSGYRQPFDNTNSTLRGLIGLSGPYDFLPMRNDDVIEVFGDKATSMESQPIHYASADAPPSLLVTSKQDIIVCPRNAHRLAEALTNHGVSVETSVFSNLTHTGTLLALAAPLRWRAPVLEHILGFIRRQAIAP